jgi:hypothetical protein
MDPNTKKAFSEWAPYVIVFLIVIAIVLAVF